MVRPAIDGILPGSFRDPSGFVFSHNGTIYRQINVCYQDTYERLVDSGLYSALCESGWLIPHEEAGREHALSDAAYKVIKPEQIPFVSYPYEWCFSQLKEAALLTLRIQIKALDFGMSLKDCSSYNVQFQNGKPIFIDTLSFESYQEGQPWTPYRQFCQHFLAPLSLVCYRDARLNLLLRHHLDGIPLDLASSLLPFRTRFRFSTLTHVHLHAKAQKYLSAKASRTRKHTMSRSRLFALIENLETAVRALRWRPRGAWADYYETAACYSTRAFQQKKQFVAESIDVIQPANVWDLGANTGLFSRLASQKKIPVLSFDSDPAAVEINYRECVNSGEALVLPLVLDLTNPSPALGWKNEERASLLERGPADTVLALALIHHLAISHNLPLSHIARFFASLCQSLIVEYVPKSDPQAKRLLATREDIFPDYTQQSFESEFRKYFEIRRAVQLVETDRILYCMQKR
jgi:ribosomal protein L11 methylase PrmA